MGKKKDGSEFVAVKLDGPFTEWYVPGYDDPYGEDAGYTEYYNEHILPRQPVYGPPLGRDSTAYITNDLQCLAERLSCCCLSDNDDADLQVDGIKGLFEAALSTGGVIRCEFPGNEQIILTPYRRKDLPPINKRGLSHYGRYAKMVAERVAAI